VLFEKILRALRSAPFSNGASEGRNEVNISFASETQKLWKLTAKRDRPPHVSSLVIACRSYRKLEGSSNRRIDNPSRNDRRAPTQFHGIDSLDSICCMLADGIDTMSYIER